MKKTKDLSKKLANREKLLAEFTENIEKAKKAVTKYTSDLKAAEESDDIRGYVTIERQLKDAQRELELSQSALVRATEHLAITKEYINDEWERGPRAEFVARRAKADVMVEKAYKAFTDAIEAAAKIGAECCEEADEWKEFFAKEDSKYDRYTNACICNDAGCVFPIVIFREYLNRYGEGHANPPSIYW